MWEMLTLWVESEFNHDQARFSGVVRIKISFSAQFITLKRIELYRPSKLKEGRISSYKDNNNYTDLSVLQRKYSEEIITNYFNGEEG